MRRYGSRRTAHVEMHGCDDLQLVRWSKNRIYETPYCVTGTIKLTGSEQEPKDICTDRIIGTRKGIGYYS